MILHIGNRASYPVTSFVEASRIYEATRDESGEGASTFPQGTITQGRRKVARVSYNGRVWTPGPYHPEQVPLYDNRNRNRKHEED